MLNWEAPLFFLLANLLNQQEYLRNAFIPKTANLSTWPLLENKWKEKKYIFFGGNDYNSEQNLMVPILVWRLWDCRDNLEFPPNPMKWNSQGLIHVGDTCNCFTKQISITLFWCSSDYIIHMKNWPKYFCFTEKRNCPFFV